MAVDPPQPRFDDAAKRGAIRLECEATRLKWSVRVVKWFVGDVPIRPGPARLISVVFTTTPSKSSRRGLEPGKNRRSMAPIRPFQREKSGGMDEYSG